MTAWGNLDESYEETMACMPCTAQWEKEKNFIPYSAKISRAVNFSDYTVSHQSTKIISAKMNRWLYTLPNLNVTASLKSLNLHIERKRRQYLITKHTNSDSVAIGIKFIPTSLTNFVTSSSLYYEREREHKPNQEMDTCS